MDSRNRIKVYVDGAAVLLLNGMTVRHALIAADLLSKGEDLRVLDEWGNDLGLDGALHDEMIIKTERRK
ncbi:MAG: hypothetical protein PHN75_03905 [Syntrophales bacterium]|nr:hypothetical protein [Syntrophales bacterium]